jgi:hypothetical protein
MELLWYSRGRTGQLMCDRREVELIARGLGKKRVAVVIQKPVDTQSCSRVRDGLMIAAPYPTSNKGESN